MFNIYIRCNLQVFPIIAHIVPIVTFCLFSVSGSANIRPSATRRRPTSRSYGSISKDPAVDSDLLSVALPSSHITPVVQSVSVPINRSTSMQTARSITGRDVEWSRSIGGSSFPGLASSIHIPEYNTLSPDLTTSQELRVGSSVTVANVPSSDTIYGSQGLLRTDLVSTVRLPTLDWMVSTALISGVTEPITQAADISEAGVFPTDLQTQIRSSFIDGKLLSLHSGYSGVDIMAGSQTADATHSQMTSSAVDTQFVSLGDVVTSPTEITSDTQPSGKQATLSFSGHVDVSDSYTVGSRETSPHTPSGLHLQSVRRNAVTFNQSEAFSVSHGEITTPIPAVTPTSSSFIYPSTTAIIPSPTITSDVVAPSVVNATDRQTSEQNGSSSVAVSGMAEFFTTLTLASAGHEITHTLPLVPPASMSLSTYTESSSQYVSPVDGHPSSETMESSLGLLSYRSVERIISASGSLLSTYNADSYVSSTYMDSSAFSWSSSDHYQNDNTNMTATVSPTQASTSSAIIVTDEAQWTSTTILPSASIFDGGSEVFAVSDVPSSSMHFPGTVSATSPLSQTDWMLNTISVNDTSELAYVSTVDANNLQTIVSHNFTSMTSTTIEATMSTLLNTTVESNTPQHVFSDKIIIPTPSIQTSAYFPMSSSQILATPQLNSSSYIDVYSKYSIVSSNVTSVPSPAIDATPSTSGNRVEHTLFRTVNNSDTLNSVSRQTHNLTTPRLTPSSLFFETESTYVNTDTSFTSVKMYPSMHTILSSQFGDSLVIRPSMFSALETVYVSNHTTLSSASIDPFNLSPSYVDSIYPAHSVVDNLVTVTYNQSLTNAPSYTYATATEHMFDSSVIFPERSDGSYIFPSATLYRPMSTDLNNVSVVASISVHSSSSRVSGPPEGWNMSSLRLSTPQPSVLSQSPTTPLFKSDGWYFPATDTVSIPYQPSVSSAATRETWNSLSPSASTISPTVQVWVHDRIRMLPPDAQQFLHEAHSDWIVETSPACIFVHAFRFACLAKRCDHSL